MSFLLSAEAPAPRPQQRRGHATEALDALLVDALRGSATASLLPQEDDQALLGRIAYHGVAGLLVSENRLAHWPAALVDEVRELALAQTMWELRHAATLRPLLKQFADAGIATLLLKGTALAYDLYPNPSERARCDSDLLIREQDLSLARRLLSEAGFCPPSEGGFLPPSLRSQESWNLLAADGSGHCIDLHWRPLNSPALDQLFAVDEWFERARPLPRLSEVALAADRPRMLLHACLHRSLHDCAPYQVGIETHFGGNRLIWLWDMVLLGRAMSESEWRRFCGIAGDKGVGDACRAGLDAASHRFGPMAPAWVADELAGAGTSPYFSSGQLRRAWLDWLAMPGVTRRLRYLRARALPDGAFMRAKYPRLSGKPLPLLYGRRLLDLLRRRP